MGTVSPRPILLKSPAQSPNSDSGSNGKKADTPQRPITRLSISKNYTIPPRPKPGRKPNNDVPPSRRKAQNREAQRAFRERKSQAVKQLEEQLAKQAQAFERQQEQMKEQIMLLQRQNIQLQYSPQSPQSPQSPHSNSPPALQPLLAAAGVSPGSSPAPCPAPALIPGGSNSPQPATPIPQITGAPASPSVQQISSNSPNFNFSGYSLSPKSPGSPFGTPVTPADFVSLELLDQVLDQKLPTPNGHHRRSSSSLSSVITKKSSRQTSPTSPSSVHKRRLSTVRDRTNPPVTNSPLDLINTSWSQPAVPLRRNSRPLEVDFTSAFTPREPRPLLIRSPPAPKDRCGFCTDSSPCICAATAAREEGVSAELATDLTTLGSPAGSFLIESDISTSISPNGPETKLNGSSALNDGECTGNPDSCSQCRQDPMLTLFCSAISSKQPSTMLSPYCTYIPAQAAYKTLSRHPRFGFADLGMIVDVLQVRSTQVEVNSVAKALRILDTR